MKQGSRHSDIDRVAPQRVPVWFEITYPTAIAICHVVDGQRVPNPLAKDNVATVAVAPEITHRVEVLPEAAKQTSDAIRNDVGHLTANIAPIHRTHLPIMNHDTITQNQSMARAALWATTEELNQTATDFAPAPDDVARRAYFSYVNEGAQPGQAVQHWLAAEADLIAEYNRTLAPGYRPASQKQTLPKPRLENQINDTLPG